MRQTIFLFALGFAALTAHGQAVFRSVMPDGSIIYGDKPAPGAREAKEVTLPKPNIIAPVAPKLPPAAKPKDEGKEAAPDPVKSAQERLDAAKAALEAGREEKDGDRIANAPNFTPGFARFTTRLREEYYQRVKALEDAVAAAQKQLDDARR